MRLHSENISGKSKIWRGGRHRYKWDQSLPASAKGLTYPQVKELVNLVCGTQSLHCGWFRGGDIDTKEIRVSLPPWRWAAGEVALPHNEGSCSSVLAHLICFSSRSGSAPNNIYMFVIYSYAQYNKINDYLNVLCVNVYIDDKYAFQQIYICFDKYL